MNNDSLKSIVDGLSAAAKTSADRAQFDERLSYASDVIHAARAAVPKHYDDREHWAIMMVAFALCIDQLTPEERVNAVSRVCLLANDLAPLRKSGFLLERIVDFRKRMQES